MNDGNVLLKKRIRCSENRVVRSLGAQLPSPVGCVRLAQNCGIVPQERWDLRLRAFKTDQFDKPLSNVAYRAMAHCGEDDIMRCDTPVRVILKTPPIRITEPNAGINRFRAPSIGAASYGLKARVAVYGEAWVVTAKHRKSADV